jgi:hypothetical protein
MYHLRHPLLAIDNMRRICKGFFIFETCVDINNPNQFCASSKFYRTTEIGPISNWTGATAAGFNSWLKDAGFNDIYYADPGFPGPPRQIFIAVADPIYNDIFKNNKNLHHCNKDYWDKVYNETKFKK